MDFLLIATATCYYKKINSCIIRNSGFSLYLHLHDVIECIGSRLNVLSWFSLTSWCTRAPVTIVCQNWGHIQRKTSHSDFSQDCFSVSVLVHWYLQSNQNFQLKSFSHVFVIILLCISVKPKRKVKFYLVNTRCHPPERPSLTVIQS